MGVYIGNKKKKLYLSKILYAPVIFSGILLRSRDNYILKDSNGVYLTGKRDE